LCNSCVRDIRGLDLRAKSGETSGDSFGSRSRNFLERTSARGKESIIPLLSIGKGIAQENSRGTSRYLCLRGEKKASSISNGKRGGEDRGSLLKI